jgi:hypothetical protein
MEGTPGASVHSLSVLPPFWTTCDTGPCDAT